MKNEVVNSPVTGKQSKLLKTYSVEQIVSDYKKELGIDVEKEFLEESVISLYECTDTKYQFFSPVITGGSDFYEKLQKFSWYYMPWKWEHAVSNFYIDKDDNVLEVGCATGDFLNRIKKETECAVWGIEYNEKAIKECHFKGIPVNRYDSDFLAQKKDFFDVVCSFQVLEHIPDVKTFFLNASNVLKSNGQLLVCVPNIDSFIKYSDGDILNYPPHHIGWWKSKSLVKTVEYFGFKNIEVFFEPLQEYHFNWYIRSQLIRFNVPTCISRIILSSKLKSIRDKFMSLIANKIHGHSILVRARKR